MSPDVLRSAFARTVEDGRFLMRSTVTARVRCGCGCGKFGSSIHAFEICAARLGAAWRVASMGELEAAQKVSEIDTLASLSLAETASTTMQRNVTEGREALLGVATSIMRADGTSATSVVMLNSIAGLPMILQTKVAVARQALELSGATGLSPFPANVSGLHGFPPEALVRAPILAHGRMAVDCLLCYQDGKAYVEDLSGRFRVAADEADVIRVGSLRMSSKNVIAAAEWMKTFGAAALEGVDVSCY